MTFPAPETPVETITRGPITLEMLRLYARASGDHNPIHVDEATARAAGLPGIIAHGMLSAGFLADRALEVMNPWASEWKLADFQTRFKAMVLLGDTVTISGVFKSIGADSVCLELGATTPRGEVATQAWAEFRRR